MTGSHFILPASEIERLIDALVRRGYEVDGPTVRDGAIVYDRLTSVEELPRGWGDEQAAGRYRLKRRDDDALFGYTVGPQSWKNLLHPPEVRLFSGKRQDGTFQILENDTHGIANKALRTHAFLGVRPCELQAIAIQDHVLIGEKFRDPIYEKRREGLFVVVVQCTQAAETCFCASMGTGPRANSGFDLALTELVAPGGHQFIVECGSDRGGEVLRDLKVTPASDSDVQGALALVDAVAAHQDRSIDREGVKDLLDRSFEHPRWGDVARRCLTCGNCTMVCPTCFCTSVDDTSDISGERADRWRHWDSCFTLNFSYIHGGSIRNSTQGRYRQWITHKLATWFDQFGCSGCVGCGRCITWCPVGIDITEEVRAIRESHTHGKS